ncbi:hypothetical protein GQ457_11G029330 [Hibiscus cannabinus]
MDVPSLASIAGFDSQYRNQPHFIIFSLFSKKEKEGNVVSFMVSLSPLKRCFIHCLHCCRPTFYQIYKKKTSEGFQSLPYVVSLFSAILWIYYALLKKDVMLLITINTFCVFIQTFYIITYFYYGPKKEKVPQIMEFPACDRQTCYICMAFALGVFAAPLAIVRKVIKTKSVEFMPFYLSLFLTLGAVMWFFYGLLLKDMNIAVPNVLGLIFGILQMILYAIYKNHPKKVVEDPNLQLPDQHIVNVVKLGTVVCLDVNGATPPQPNNKNYGDGGGDASQKV